MDMAHVQLPQPWPCHAACNKAMTLVCTPCHKCLFDFVAVISLTWQTQC